MLTKSPRSNQIIAAITCISSRCCRYAQSKHLDLQQRCTEVLSMLEDITLMSEVLPMDASTEDLEPDEVRIMIEAS